VEISPELRAVKLESKMKDLEKRLSQK